jgi:hypothetical protein
MNLQVRLAVALVSLAACGGPPASRQTFAAFRGYAIWDWVHGMVNVPNTYKETQK